MAQRKSSTSSHYPSREAKGAKTPTKFHDYSKQIFESREMQCPPTDQRPIPQRKQLAGD